MAALCYGPFLRGVSPGWRGGCASRENGLRDGTDLFGLQRSRVQLILVYSETLRVKAHNGVQVALSVVQSA